MKREELKEILDNAGLENSKNIVDLILSKHQSTASELKKQVDELSTQFNSVKTELETFKTEKTQLEEKLSTFGDYENILNENKSLKEKETLNSRKEKLKENNVLEKANDFIMDKINWNEDVNSQIETFKQEYPFIFNQEAPKFAKPVTQKEIGVTKKQDIDPLNL